MKRLRFLPLLVLLIHLFCQNSTAQANHKIDSLKRVFPINFNDSLKVSGYADLCWYYITGQKQDSAKMYADTIRIISHEIEYPYGLLLSHFYYGVIDRYTGDYHQGIDHLVKFVEYYEQKGDSNRVAAGLFQIAAINSKLGNYEECLEAYQRTLNIYKQSENEVNIAQMRHAMAHIQREMGKHIAAIENYKKAIEVWNKINNVSGLSMSIESLGNTYGEVKQYDKAEEFLLKALDIVRGENRPFGIASVTENLGSLYGNMERYETALNYHLESLAIKSSLPSKDNLVVGLNNVGACYTKLGEYDKAKGYLVKGLELAKTLKVSPLIMTCHKKLTELYELMDMKDAAFEHQKLYITIKDSMFTAEKNKQLIELETKYETAQKDQEITLLTKENEVQQANAEKASTLRSALIGGLLLLGIIAGLIFYTMRTRLRNLKLLAIKNEEIKMANLKEQLGTLEMKALRAQMNPHFLFNCMNSINRMIMEEENDKASKYLSKFSKLVRLLLENSENPKVNLKDELEMLKSYIELESIRFKNKMEYQIKVEEYIDQESTYIPSMVLQPFVENAIWHGLLHKDTKGQLTIDIKEEGDNLHCSITDNGVGREKSLKLQKKSGHKKISMGIKITTDRLKLLTKQKISEAIKILDLKDGENNAVGTQVNILIPIS